MQWESIVEKEWKNFLENWEFFTPMVILEKERLESVEKN